MTASDRPSSLLLKCLASERFGAVEAVLKQGVPVTPEALDLFFEKVWGDPDTGLPSHRGQGLVQRCWPALLPQVVADPALRAQALRAFCCRVRRGVWARDVTWDDFGMDALLSGVVNAVLPVQPHTSPTPLHFSALSPLQLVCLSELDGLTMQKMIGQGADPAHPCLDSDIPGWTLLGAMEAGLLAHRQGFSKEDMASFAKQNWGATDANLICALQVNFHSFPKVLKSFSSYPEWLALYEKTRIAHRQKALGEGLPLVHSTPRAPRF